MSTPELPKNQPSKLKKLLSGGETESSPLTRLPRGGAAGSSGKTVATSRREAPSRPSEKKPGQKFDPAGYRFMPAFWTIASVMSFTVNIVLILLLVGAWQNFRALGLTMQGLGDQLLGGLYMNFVKMDEAHIKTNIEVSKEIPVQFTLNVSGPTNVTLSQDVAISGALVTVNTGGLNINNARANIVLPQGTVLPILIENLEVPVDQKVLAELNVPVDIPLNQTELHEPFVGLQEVIKPFYCLLGNCE